MNRSKRISIHLNIGLMISMIAKANSGSEGQNKGEENDDRSDHHGRGVDESIPRIQNGKTLSSRGLIINENNLWQND